jgi:hypothetical protein
MVDLRRSAYLTAHRSTTHGLSVKLVLFLSFSANSFSRADLLKSCLHAIAEREQELVEIEKSLCQEEANEAAALRNFDSRRHAALSPGTSLFQYPASSFRAGSSHRFHQNDSDSGEW